MKITASKSRRKPQQSRSRMTQAALLESFVRLLPQHSYDDLTIRTITELAGVGLGSFYEYFATKDQLAALCIHQQIKQQALAIQQHAAELPPGLTLREQITRLIDFQCTSILAQQSLWAQLFLLERQLTSHAIYQKHYVLHVRSWVRTLTICGLPSTAATERLGLNLHRLSYGFISQALLLAPDQVHWDALRYDLMQAISGYLP